MSTRVDILAARDTFGKHLEEHKCRAGTCPERTRLWLAYQDTAARWGTELDDAERVREQYKWQEDLLGRRAG